MPTHFVHAVLGVELPHPIDPDRSKIKEAAMNAIPGDLKFMKSHEWARVVYVKGNLKLGFSS